MDTTMELDDLKQAWATLDRRLARQEDLRLHMFRSDRLDKARRGLRPLFWGQLLQVLFGSAITALGESLWYAQSGTPHLLAIGLALHAYGVITIIASGLVLAQMQRIDYAAPVLAIQRRFAALRRTYGLASLVVGVPWWLLWLFVTVAICGVAGIDLVTAAPGFFWFSLAVGVIGIVATVAFVRRTRARQASQGQDPDAHDCGSLRRAELILDEVARFERE